MQFSEWHLPFEEYLWDYTELAKKQENEETNNTTIIGLGLGLILQGLHNIFQIIPSLIQ